MLDFTHGLIMYEYNPQNFTIIRQLSHVTESLGGVKMDFMDFGTYILAYVLKNS